MAERPVNTRQREVLQWVVAGCPTGVMTDTTHKTTAVALQNRGLVVITKRRGTWHATPTEAGLHYAKHGTYPRRNPPAAGTPTPATDTQRPTPQPNSRTPRSKPEPAVPVAARLSSRPHPAVARLKQGNRLNYKGDLRSRALRILDALVKEAERRGYKVTASNRSEELFRIEVRGHGYGITLREPTNRTPHIKTADETRRAERTGYDWSPRYDYTPSGRLALRVGGYGDQFTEPKNGNWTLEERLDRVLKELEDRASAAEAREQERRREQAERQARWETVRAEAETALTEHHRATTLTRQAQQWRDHQLLTDYIAAMETHTADLSPEEATNAHEWIAWAHTYLTATQPFRNLQLPPPPKPTPDALRPYMRGLSPHGPDSYL